MTRPHDDHRGATWRHVRVGLVGQALGHVRLYGQKSESGMVSCGPRTRALALAWRVAWRAPTTDASAASGCASTPVLLCPARHVHLLIGEPRADAVLSWSQTLGARCATSPPLQSPAHTKQHYTECTQSPRATHDSTWSSGSGIGGRARGAGTPPPRRSLNARSINVIISADTIETSSITQTCRVVQGREALFYKVVEASKWPAPPSAHGCARRASRLVRRARDLDGDDRERVDGRASPARGAAAAAGGAV